MMNNQINSGGVGTDAASLAAVLGALADAAATGAVTSVDTAMAYIKQIVTEGIARDAAIAIIDAFFAVPSADSTDNVIESDVIGNKTDAAAVGGVSTGESLVAYLKEVILGLGLDGVTSYISQFDDSNLIGNLFGQHQTVDILFVIPEALASISADNAAILLELEKYGHVDQITQANALTYPDFPQYNLIVLGSNSDTAWTTANLADIKEFEGTVITVDEVSANFLAIGGLGGDAAAKTSLVAITEIEANDLGIGHGPDVGLAAGANTVSSSATYNTLDMSDADITETFFGTESVADNTDVLLGVVFKRQADGTRGIDSDGFEVRGTRWFYGCAYSADLLNTLGTAVLGLIFHMALQASTEASLEISGDIGDIEKKLFGNQANEFNNGNPLVEYLTGRNSSGTRLPVGKSLYDLLGAYVDAGGGAGTDNIAADFALNLAAIAIVDAFHDVPAADNTDNTQMRDVIGNMADAAVTGAPEADETIVAILKQLVNMQRRAKHTLHYKSATLDPIITLNATAADEALPSVVVAGIPSGAVITKVTAWVSIGEFKNSDASDNSLVLAGTEHIQVKETAAGSFVDAIKLVAGQWLTEGSAVRGGNVYMGEIDIKAEVDADDTYSFQIEGADVTAASLILRDVQCGLIIEYTLE